MEPNDGTDAFIFLKLKIELLNIFLTVYKVLMVLS